MPGMDVRARLTVVGDGPVGAVGQKLDQRFGLPAGHARREWALGMKMVIELPGRFHARSRARCGTPSDFPSRRSSDSSTCTRSGWSRWASSFRHGWATRRARPIAICSTTSSIPCLWRHLKGGTLRSWGAKSLEESGKHGEPFLTGDGFARIGEGSGSTNMLTGSGVDEAWTTGVQLGEAVLELLRAGQALHARESGCNL